MVAAVGDRRALLLGLGITAVAGVAGATAPSFALLLISRLLEGLGFLLIIVAGPAILQRLTTGSARDSAFSLWSCFMPSGMALAMVAGPLFQTWQGLWWSGSALAVVAAAAVACCIPAGVSPGVPGRILVNIRRVLFSRVSVLLAICFALYSLMFFALFSFLPVLLMERMDISYRSAGLLSSLASVINVSGNLAAGYLLTRGAGRGSLILLPAASWGRRGLAY